MTYLKRAELYALERGDEFYFKNLYTQFRAFNDVTESVWRTLSYLYSNQIAHELLNDPLLDTGFERC